MMFCATAQNTPQRETILAQRASFARAPRSLELPHKSAFTDSAALAVLMFIAVLLPVLRGRLSCGHAGGSCHFCCAKAMAELQPDVPLQILKCELRV